MTPTSTRRISVPAFLTFLVLAVGGASLLLAPSRAQTTEKGTSTQPDKSLVQRGDYLVNLGGCNDCHTPLKMGPNGPEPDMSRMLSGHPEQLKMPAPPKLPEGPWNVVVAMTMTAYAGPFGISYASNLTPDENTGIGNWSEDIFMKTIRTGKHWGVARPILPPMPWANIARLPDADLRAIYAYLRSIPAVVNHVPESQPAPVPGH